MAFIEENVMVVVNWFTPATPIPEQTVGRYSIKKKIAYEGMILPMNEVFGYDSVMFLTDCVITTLNEDGKLWMSDSPYEYYSMWELAARAKGPRVLIGGLGLGLLANILSNFKYINQITVIELSREVIQMIKPYIPSWVEVIHGDFLKMVPELSSAGRYYETIIVDIFTGRGIQDRELYDQVRMTLEDWYPASQYLFWHYQKEYERGIAEIEYWRRVMK